MTTGGRMSGAWVSVASFLETGRSALEMELVAGEKGLNHRIPEAAINRPGLALSGFFDYFARRRIQVLGLAEITYLAALTEAEREARLRAFFEQRIPCAVVARHKKVSPEMTRLAEAYRIPLLRTRMITKHFINAATILMENLTAPRAKVQGTMVEIMGIGVLIAGKAGVGKSETALALIRKGAALVSDDVTCLRRDSAGSVIGCAARVTRYHMEIRGLGIVHVPSLFGVASVREEKKLDLVARLQAQDEVDRVQSVMDGRRSLDLLGVQVPEVMIPVAPGRDLANVVETAALDQKLRRLGHDATKELDERLMSLMCGGRNVSE